MFLAGSLLGASSIGARYVVVDDPFELYTSAPESFAEIESPADAEALGDDVVAVLVPGHAKPGTLEAVSKAKRVTALSVRQCTLRSAEITSVAGMEKLEYLALYACAGLNEEIAAALAKLPALRTLILNSTANLDPQVLGAFAKAPRIEFISFNSLKGEDHEVGALQQLKNFKTLRGVNVSFSTIPDAALRAVCAIPALQLLALPYSQFDHKLAGDLIGAMELLRAIDLAKVCSGPLLQSIARKADLTALRISGCELSDADASCLPKLTKLEWLDIQHNHDLTDGSLSALGTLKALRVLRLCWTSLTDKGLAELSGLTLHELDLEGCEALTDDAIATLLKMESMKALNLSWHSTISGSEVRKLSALKNLLKLGVNHCTKVSKADVKHLQETRPDLEVCASGIR